MNSLWIRRTPGAGPARAGLRWVLPLVCLAALCGGCAVGTTVLEPENHEGFNRGVWGFNMWLDDHAFEAMGRGWDAITSRGVQQSVANFADNLDFPKRFLGNLFQVKLPGAGIELTRFVINTTVGILGFFDPALAWGIEPRPEDFDQTFAYWGSDAGCYWVLPFLGPSSTRGNVALPFDFVTSGSNLLFIIPQVNWRAMNLERIATNRENAIDFYVFVRNAYEQRRDDLNHDFKERPEDDAAEDDLYFLDEDDE